MALSSRSTKKRVFIYLETMPQRQGSGASLRFYSNVRAYLDLGFDVEVIQIAPQPDGSQPSRDLHPVAWKRVIEPVPEPTLFGRLMYRVGIPQQAAVEYYFRMHRLVAREVKLRRQQAPEAIHHFEGESLANVIPWLPKDTRSVWSLHDLPSMVAEAKIKIACEINRREQTVPEKRELRFTRRLERFMAQHAPLILCISDYDRERLQCEWGCKQAEYLPMSIPGDGADRATGNWLQGGRLRLLHLGRVSHLPSYRSLEFLFERVFPKLSPSVFERISLNIVGRVDPDDERAKRILALAAPYQNVSFLGFVEDVIPCYDNSDVQVVASTDAAGLRTRIIESFAYGLPVLSTSVGARGIAGLKAGEHLLIADDAEQFAEQLACLAKSPNLLDKLSRNGRDFYLKSHSTAVVASRLARYLWQHLGVATHAEHVCVN